MRPTSRVPPGALCRRRRGEWAATLTGGLRPTTRRRPVGALGEAVCAVAAGARRRIIAIAEMAAAVASAAASAAASERRVSWRKGCGDGYGATLGAALVCRPWGLASPPSRSATSGGSLEPLVATLKARAPSVGGDGEWSPSGSASPATEGATMSAGC